MPLILAAGGAQRVFTLSAAAFLLIVAFPSSAGWRVFFLVVASAALLWRAFKGEQPLDLALLPRALVASLAAWAALAVASLAWSVDAGYTLQELRRELLYGTWTFLVFFIGTRTAGQLHLWLRMLLAAALLLGLTEWLRLADPASELFRKVSLGPGPFSTHVLMMTPLLLLVVWPGPIGMGRSVQLTTALAVALILAGIAGESRILWPALLAAAAVAFVVFASQTPRQHPSRKPVRRAFIAALVLLPALMFLSSEYKLRYYPRAASTLESFAFDERPLIWKEASRKAAELPWLGHGYGREIIGPDLRAALAKAGQPKPYNHGHNVFLDAMIQLGVLGLAVFAMLMAALAWAFAAALKRESGTPLAIVGLAVFTGYLAKNLTDDFFFRPNSLVFWAIAGMLLGLAARLAKTR
jgi:O-antigen ligase